MFDGTSKKEMLIAFGGTIVLFVLLLLSQCAISKVVV